MNTDGSFLLGEVNNFVSREHQRIAEILSDYDPSLTLIFLPADKRDGLDDFPFAVYCTPPAGQPYIVRRVRYEDMNENLVAWAFANDQEHISLDNILAAHDAANEAVKLKRNMEYEDLKVAQLDFTKSVLQGKNYFRHNGKIYR